MTGQTIKRTVRVTVERLIEIEIPANFSEPKYIADWCSGLWHIDSVDDILKHAAETASLHGCGEYDGLGLMSCYESRKPEVKYEILEENAESEFED